MREGGRTIKDTLRRNGALRLAGIGKRALGATLLVFGLLPVYRALDTLGDAPFRQDSVKEAEATLHYAWWGSVLVVLFAVLLAFLFSDMATRWGRRIGKLLERPRQSVFAAGVGLLAFGLSWAVGTFVFQGLYTNVDEIASAIQARYMAGGSLAGPLLRFPEAWIITNTLMVPRGWVSQYPPSHLAVMALFFRLGVPTLVGPVLMGLMAWLLALSFPRLLPTSKASARAGALLVSVSPFLLLLAGGSLSHLTAGAAGAAVLYSSLRARDGSWGWGLATGAAVGVMVMARPLVGVVLGTAFPLALWGARLVKEKKTRWALHRVGAILAGGLPFAVLLGLYNHDLFGSATRFGYLAAFGDNHKLGFHLDPWGYMYGLGSAVAFTSTDLLALGVRFFETPLPLTVAVGVFLLLGPRLPRGAGLLLAWALLPALANAFYWFHSPRMMFEAAPAWILLCVLAVEQIVRWSEEDGRGRPGRSLGQVTAWAAVVSLLLAVGWGVPTRVESRRWTQETLGRIRVPAVPADVAALVFVHASWNERLSSRLQGAGDMRQDSIVSILRRNTNCQLQRYTDAREAIVRDGRSDLPLPPVDLDQASSTPQGLLHVSPFPGVSVRVRERETLSPECVRELQADRFGAVSLAPLLWQGDLPGDERGRPLFVRDLGPERNAQVRALYPARRAFFFGPLASRAAPSLVPYDEGMRLLWGELPAKDSNH